MTDADERRRWAAVVREQAKLIRELTAARALLKYCQKNKVYPMDFERELADLRSKPAYQEVVQELDIIASRIEQSAGEMELKELLQKLPTNTPIN